MLKLFKSTNFRNVKSEILLDQSIIVNGDYNTIVMYTFFLRSSTREVLVYKRPETYYYEEFREMLSIGYGGRLEIEDLVRGEAGTVQKMESIISSGLREIEEEVTYSGNRFGFKDVTYVGLIEEETSALVCAIEVDSKTEIRTNEPENEHVGWMTIDELVSKKNLLEPWSRDIVLGFLIHYNNSISMESKGESGWKKIPGYSNYMASTEGKIKNLITNRISSGGNAGRYLKVSVLKDGEKEPHLEYLHILICKTFNGPGREGDVVLHKNNLRHDCRASNLKWGTQSDNVQDAYDSGLVENKGSNRS